MIEAEKEERQLGLLKSLGSTIQDEKLEGRRIHILSLNGEDVYMDAAQTKLTGTIADGSLVIFRKGSGEGESAESYIDSANEKTDDAATAFKLFIRNYPSFASSEVIENFRKAVELIFRKMISERRTIFTKAVREVAKTNRHVYQFIERGGHEKIDFEVIFGNRPASEVLDWGPSELMTYRYMEENQSDIYEFMESIGVEEARRLLKPKIDIIPVHLLLACIVKNIFAKDDLSSGRIGELYQVIEGVYRDNRKPFPAFLTKAFRSEFKDKEQYLSKPLLKELLEPILFKKYLYEKNPKFNELFNGSELHRKNLETFVLSNIFSLIHAGNSLDTVYSVFMQRLWEGLVDERVDINDESLFSAFPACNTIAGNLSCEAFFWPNHNEFLCRGKACKYPQVIPDNNKHYLDFNIYDWFQHYSINYSVEKKPSRRDFPIKVAGYFNRLKEVFPVLHCRSCNKVLRPDMRYARVEYIDYSSGKPVIKNMSAAYRATVFACGSASCSEHGKTHYINHCIGFGCYSVIDSRDLKVSCSEGYRICKSCGGCCGMHAKDNPVGFCPQCGSYLELHSSLEQSGLPRKKSHRVICSNEECDFELSGELPKKFGIIAMRNEKK